MGKSTTKLSKLKVYGQKASADDIAKEVKGEYLQLTGHYTLSAQRASSEEQIISLKDDESIELVFEDDTIWFGDKTTIMEVFPELDEKNRSVSDIPELPMYIEAGDESRGLFGKIAIRILKIFSKKITGVAIAKIAADLDRKILDGRSGLFGLDASFNLSSGKTIKSNTSTLLLLHGTVASTEKSFKHLKDSDLWKEISDQYADNLFCFEHETLTKGPFQNTLELIRSIAQVRDNFARYGLLRLLSGGGLVLRDVQVDGLALTLIEDERGWNQRRGRRTGFTGFGGREAVIARVASTI